ncbi:F-box/kelch-repeat protein At3g23880-like [Quercus lobata]|uniref:F-box domain-containing protein n=1 Tax=Quercus lobata TaxID=97700 RepID=A0A7N2R7D5_QUELO|nr:F-box/kelch-repeat protein At3g23880-like [Quercus lobata]
MSRPTEKRLPVPDDVVFDILTWLPVKSLIRFRCVSKSWYSTITNPIFITTHLNHNKAKESLSIDDNNNNNGYLLYTHVPKDFSSRHELCTAVYNSDHTLTQISAFQIPFSGFNVASFCNGMFCLDCLTDHGDHIICLWNPSIRKFKTLAPFRLIDYVDSGTLRLESVTLGLAYNSQNNDFKILRLACFYDIIEKFVINRFRIEAEIYTSSTDSWRKVEISVESLSRPIFILGKRCVFVNGALHIIAYFQGYEFILSFDVDDERFHEIKLPQNYSRGFNVEFRQLGVYKGLLALIVFCHDPANRGYICLIWEMKEYGLAESWTWTKKCITMNSFYSCYGCTDNGEILMKNANGLVSFDPENHQNIFTIEDARWADYTANSMESLVLLDGGNSVSEYKD